jgi:hypothetical protein
MAREIIEANRDVLDHLAAELVEHESLDVDRVQELFASVQPFTGAGLGRASTAAASEVSPNVRKNR